MSNKIRNLPDAPTPTDTPAEFNSKSFKWVDALSGWTDDVNGLGDDFNALVAEAQSAASDADQKAKDASDYADNAQQSANQSAQSAENSGSSADDSAQSATKSYAQAEAAQAHAANAKIAENNAKDYADRSGDFADASQNSAQASAKSAETSGYYQQQTQSLKMEVTALSNKADASAQLAENSKDSAQQYAQVAENWSNVAQDSAYNVLSGSDAPKWIKGTTYEVGDVVWSPKNAKIYRALFEFVSNTDPADDSENWVTASGLGSLAYQDSSSVEVESLTVTKNINNTVWMQLQPDDQEVLSAKELVHISSRGAARILLEADRNNVDEAANAQILLSQDGGSVTAHMGFWNETNSLYLINLYKENLVLGTNSENIMWFTPDGAVQIRGGVTSDAPKFSIDTSADPDGSNDVHIVQVENKSGIVRKSVNVTTFADRRVGMSATDTQSGVGEQFLLEGSSISLKDNLVVSDTSATAIKPLVFDPQDKPANPSEGMAYYDKADSTLKYWNGETYITLKDSVPAEGYGFEYDATTASPACVPGTGEAPTVTEVHRNIRACVLKADGSVSYYLNPSDWSKQINGDPSDLTGADGNVMIEIPAFYYKEDIDGSLRKPKLSSVPLPGFKLHPAFVKDGKEVAYRYYGAYDACVYSESSKEYIDGLNLDNNASFINPATGKPRVDPSVDKLASVKGFYPMVGLTRNEFRQLAANVGEGWRQVDYDLVAAVQLLYLVEYQTFFSQAVLGSGNTNGSYVASSDSQIDSPHTIAGAGDSIGTGSTDPTTGAGVNAKPGTSFMKYRGIENFYGNAWNWADGINVNIGNVGTVYVTNDSQYFADNTSEGMKLVASTLPTDRGYISQLQKSPPYFLSASNSGGSSTTYVTDYHYGSSSLNRVVLVGGGAAFGASAGSFCLLSDCGSSYRYRTLGGRLAF